MNHHIYTAESFHHLAVNVPLDEAFWCVLRDRFCVFNPIFNHIISGCDKCRRHVATHEKGCWVFRIANADVAICIEYAIFVKDMVACDEGPHKHLAVFGLLVHSCCVVTM